MSMRSNVVQFPARSATGSKIRTGDRDPKKILAQIMREAKDSSSNDPCERCDHRPSVEQTIEGDGNIQISSRLAFRQVIRGNGNLQADIKAWDNIPALVAKSSA